MWSEFISFFICEMGPTLTVKLAVRIRDNQHQVPEQRLVHRSYPPRSYEKPCAHVQMMEQNKTGPSREIRDVNRTQQEERRIQDGSMGECAWDEPGKMGRMLTGRERRGDSTRNKSCEGRRAPATGL